jgi:hypothetical protein
MNKRFTHFCATGILALTTSCAGTYTLIHPKTISSYTPSQSTGPVSMEYQFDALRLRRGNKKYIKKETKFGYRVAAVRLTNNGDREVNFTRDLNLYLGDRPIVPTSSAIAAHDLRQGVAIYLLYLLGNVTVGGTYDPRTNTTSGGTFLPTGVLIAGGNMLGAGSANGNLRKEFEAYDLTNRTIKPGETVYGIVSLRETSVAPLRVELRNSTPVPPPPTPPAAAMPTNSVPTAPSIAAPASPDTPSH